MRPLEPFQLEISECLKELDALDKLLSSKKELMESEDILPFFKKHKNIAAYIGSYAPGIVAFDRLSIEYTLFGDFRADAVVGDSARESYCFVEFEDATKDSIFRKTSRTTSEWSDRFEHGYSQLIDWLWKIDDFRPTAQCRSIFGSDTFEFMGMLIIGRDEFLAPEEVVRLKWRINKVIINSQKIVCLTFDQLARDLRESLCVYQGLQGHKGQGDG